MFLNALWDRMGQKLIVYDTNLRIREELFGVYMCVRSSFIFEDLIFKIQKMQ